MAETLTIGYGNPPKNTQWKKGQSGNPKGRPRTKIDTLQDAAKILSKPVKAKVGQGRTECLSGVEATYLALCKRALAGHVSSLLTAINIMLTVQPVLDKREEEENVSREEILDMFEKMGVPVDRSK